MKGLKPVFILRNHLFVLKYKYRLDSLNRGSERLTGESSEAIGCCLKHVQRISDQLLALS